MTKQEIKKELEKSFDEVIRWIENQSEDLFEKGPENKWVTSQQLDHLHKATKAINKGMSIPKLLLKFKFGTANRPSRTFDELKKKYLDKINNMPKDFKQPIPPRMYSNNQKKERLDKYRVVANVMIGSCDKWTEGKLDKYILPHPAVGKITIREFLMWTVIHNEHHLSIMKKDYN